MPYIKKEDRKRVLANRKPLTAGELNYLLTVTILDYFMPRGNYQAANDVIGALEGCKQEFYRRHVAPYEDQKIEENGDVR